ncbi:Crp/Fnr family transcriptional regulator [Oscillatoria sp. FACHB-1406]|uniref:Crp/Fnr family transcriptional regulator n=1 Tax=Oscillatoria sp. FACHB-1406 TaxID=2692846 RepID=UPI001686924B|nr:Crp/Fnr family transcriptional regulator [Oscillatoria sp. FACHB-1406]MBD2580026.1 Crp/Fnr family transcriptional regulator [Oscillatoria sp. FACHB-1406]
MTVLPASTQSLQPISLRYERRSQLPPREDVFWKIRSGAVRTFTWSEDGSLVTLGVWGQGDVVSRLLSGANPYQIECLTAVDAIALPLSHYAEVNDALIRHVRELQEFLQILRSRPIDLGLMRLLHWLGKKFGREVETGQLIDLRLTHQELAEILGTTRVTITRILKDLEAESIIERLPGKLIILQEAASAWYYEI